MNNEIKDALNNVVRYDDFEEYSQCNGDRTQEEFAEYIADGWVGELTPGTYNGATDEFTRVSKLTDGDIIAAIEEEMMDEDFIVEMLEDIYPEAATPYQQALAFTEVYTVFTIGERLFVDRD